MIPFGESLSKELCVPSTLDLIVDTNVLNKLPYVLFDWENGFGMDENMARSFECGSMESGMMRFFDTGYLYLWVHNKTHDRSLTLVAREPVISKQRIEITNVSNGIFRICARVHIPGPVAEPAILGCIEENGPGVAEYLNTIESG